MLKIKIILVFLMCMTLKAAQPATSMEEQMQLQEAMLANQLDLFAYGIDNIQNVQDVKLIWNSLKDSIFASDNDSISKNAFKLLSDRLFYIVSGLESSEPQSQGQVQIIKNDIINMQERLGILQFPKHIDLTQEINKHILTKNPKTFAEFRTILGNRYNMQIERKLNQLNDYARKLLLDSGLDAEGLFGILSDSETNNESVIEMFS